MRFADLDGDMIDVYQAATQMTDESGQAYPVTVNTLLDRALGPQGYYGVFTANMHTDTRLLGRADASSRRRWPRRAARVGQADARLARRPQRIVIRPLSWDGSEARLHRSPPTRAPTGSQAMVPDPRLERRELTTHHAQRLAGQTPD